MLMLEDRNGERLAQHAAKFLGDRLLSLVPSDPPIPYRLAGKLVRQTNNEQGFCAPSCQVDQHVWPQVWACVCRHVESCGLSYR